MIDQEKKFLPYHPQMTLDQWVNKLPKSHSANKEYKKLQNHLRLSKAALHYYANGSHFIGSNLDTVSGESPHWLFPETEADDVDIGVEDGVTARIALRIMDAKLAEVILIEVHKIEGIVHTFFSKLSPWKLFKSGYKIPAELLVDRIWQNINNEY